MSVIYLEIQPRGSKTRGIDNRQRMNTVYAFSHKKIFFSKIMHHEIEPHFNKIKTIHLIHSLTEVL